MAALAGLPLYLLVSSQSASAQFWQWPWEQEQHRVPPSTPLPTYPSPGTDNTNTGNTNVDPLSRSPICLELEQRLATIANQGSQLRLQLPEIEQNIESAQREVRRSERQLEQADCYENFLFTRSLRRTRNCIQLDQAARRALQQLRALRSQQERALGEDDRSYQDDIIRELADNNCGNVYEREARRRNPFSNFWQDQDDTGGRGFSGNTFAGLPFATYRTVCVRLCDGFYFPVSFSTLPTHFSRDADACQARCAAPAKLYFHQNPGQSIDQMVSHETQQQYTKLKTAFRYRKEYVSGCSCKTSEYLPSNTGLASNKNVPQGSTQQRENSLGAGITESTVERGQLAPIQ